MQDNPERKQLRLKKYDYTQEGAYYVTACTRNRECLFGDVRDGKMELNEYGKIVKKEWYKTGEIRKNIELDEFTVMPNHIHGVIIVAEEYNNMGTCNVPLRRAPQRNREKFGCSVSNSISTIIKLFKASTTKQINQTRNTSKKPIWQRGFYEHVVRDEEDLNRIREYVIYNPMKWEEDKYYPNGHMQCAPTKGAKERPQRWTPEME